MEDKLTNLLIALILIIVLGLAGVYAYKLIGDNTKVADVSNQQIQEYVKPDNTEQNTITNTDSSNTNTNQEQKPSTSIVIPTYESKNNQQTQTIASTTSKYEYNNRYYYNQLEESSKAIYDAIESKIDMLKSGTETISIDYDFSSILNEKSGQTKLNRIYGDAINAINMDIPNLFYIDFSKMSLNIESTTSILGTKHKLYITPKEDETNYLQTGFSTISQVEKAIDSVEYIKEYALDSAKGEDYSRIKILHDWIIDYDSYSSTSSNRGTVYGTFIERQAVCEGYARAFKYLLDNIGINNILVIGTATNSAGNTEDHMWNYVQLNGSWYAVDCTWDDPIVQGGGTIGYEVKHRYFMAGSNTMSKTHVPRRTISPDGMDFTLPTLNSNNY